jgi:negative regulator of replication initiation
MKSIRIDDVVFAYLQSKAKPFEDSPNDVLRRELKLDINHRNNGNTEVLGQGKSPVNNSFGTNKDYTFRSVSGFTLKGHSFPARSFKDVIVNLSNYLRGLHRADFDQVALKLHGKKRSYFSKSSDGLKFPVQLSGKDLFVETNLSANGVVKISGRLLSDLGYDAREFQIN